MKKVMSLVLALVLCMMAGSAMAESVPSKTTGDLTHFEVTVDGQPAGDDLFLRPVVDTETEEYQRNLDVCQKEIEKLIASETVEQYFGDVMNMTDGSGDMVTLQDIMEEAQMNVFEFCPLVAGGFEENATGTVSATMLFSTPYEKDERVIVMIGLVTVHEDETQTVEWRAFEGIGLGVDEENVEYAGRIQVELDPETVLAVQEGTALLAIVSAGADEAAAE